MKNRNKIIFHLVILAAFIFLAAVSIGPQINRVIFPLIVLTAGIIVSLLKTFALFKPQLASVLDPSLLGDIGRSSPNQEAIHSETEEDAGAEENISKVSLTMTVLWIIGTVVGYYLIGILITTCLSTIVYMVFMSREKWINALIAAVITTLILYLGFEVALKLHLYEGLLLSNL